MAAIITVANVFDFMGTKTDSRTTNSTMMTALIVELQEDLENMLGRAVTQNSFTTTVFRDGFNCKISGNRLHLTGVYHDAHELTLVSNAGTTLTESTTYLDGNDYTFDDISGILTKVSGVWSTATSAIVITGKYGYTSIANRANARDDIKAILIEMCAIKSGLWTETLVTAEGSVTVTKKKFSKDLDRRIAQHKVYTL